MRPLREWPALTAERRSAQRIFCSAELPLAALHASGIAGQTANSGWYLKSSKYLYVANQAGFRVSSSVPDGSCGWVKYLHIVSLG